MMDVAISSLAKGYCDYSSDPVLPYVTKSIRENVAKMNNLTSAEYINYYK
jgi:hypothetical protein